jgi:hypothetical protein
VTGDRSRLRSRILLAAGALLSVALCVVVYRLVRAGEPPQRAAGSSMPPAARPLAGAPAGELTQLRRDRARLGPQVRAQADDPWASQDDVPSTRGAAENQAPLVPGPADVREARAEEERLHRQYIARVEAAFRVEATDPQWSSATSSAIRGAATGDDSLRASLRGVECRSQTCRVEIADDGSGGLDKALPMFVHQLAQQLPSVTADRVDDGRGAASMVLYMSASEAEADPPPAGSPE